MSEMNDSVRKDRRKAPRVPVETWVEEKGFNYSYFHLVTNLSRTGVRIEKRLPFTVGAKVSLELELPGGGGRLKIQGRVVDNYRDSDSNITGAGIMFINISQQDQEKIDTIIHSLQKS